MLALAFFTVIPQPLNLPTGPRHQGRSRSPQQIARLCGALILLPAYDARHSLRWPTRLRRRQHCVKAYYQQRQATQQ